MVSMAVYGWCCVYIGILIAWRQRERYTVGAGTAQQEESTVYQCNKVYTCVRCTICEHSIQPPSPELRNARVRVSRACACVRYIIILLYYYIIIILLYYYIIIFIYTQYI